MTPEVIGAFIVGLPAVVIATLLFWRRLRPVFWFALALIAVGVGYLVATGATADIAHLVMG
jgi:EamA domain-containing membrane protein RarD